MKKELTAREWLETFDKIGRDLLQTIPPMMGRPEAGTVLRQGAGGDPTVLVDEMAERTILESLAKVAEAGVGFTVVSEECGIKDFGSSEVRLLVDPVDGSNNAKKGIPYCSTSIAVLRGDRLKDLWLAFVLDLVTGKSYQAVRGEGGYIREVYRHPGRWREQNPSGGNRTGANLPKGIHLEADPIDEMPDTCLQTSSAKTIGSIAFEASSPSRDLPKIFPLLMAGRKVRCLGSIALDLALLAAGALDVVVMASPSRSFDFAAGALLLEEGHGVITDFQGNSLDEIPGGLEKTRPLLAAANVDLHRQALGFLRPYESETK